MATTTKTKHVERIYQAGSNYAEAVQGKWMVEYRALRPGTTEPWQAVHRKIFPTETAARTWVAAVDPETAR